MGRPYAKPLLVLLLFAAAPSVWAQSAPEASPKASRIAAISVIGTRAIPVNEVVASSRLKVGDVVSSEQIQAAADRMSALGLFAAVNFKFLSKRDSIQVEFQVEEAPTVPLWFDNFPWFSDSDLSVAIRQQIGFSAAQVPESGTFLEDIDAAIQSLLSTRGIKATVIHQLTAAPVGDGRIMQFRVDNSTSRVQSLKFGDARATESERLKDRSSDIVGQAYSRFALAVFQFEQIRPLYISNGYLRAQIGPPAVHANATAANPAGSPVDVVIPITPGAASTWSSVTWEGNTIFPSAALSDVVDMKAGEVANELKIQIAWQRIESEYGKRGYLDAKIIPQPVFDDAAQRVSYHVAITEGLPYRMGNLTITGLTPAAEKRLRGEWQVAQGQPFDKAYYEKMVRVLAKPSTEIFGEMPVHYNVCGYWLEPHADLHVVNILLDFK